MILQTGLPDNQVHLVSNDRERHVTGDFRSCARHFGGQVFANVHHPQHPVGVLHRPLRPPHTLGFHRIGSRPEARGIGNADRQSIHGQVLAQRVARGPGNLRDDGGIVTGQPVHEARLACIGRPGDHHIESVAKYGTLPGFAQQPLEGYRNGAESGFQFAVGVRLQFLVREVQPRLQVYPQRGQRCLQFLYSLRERAAQGTGGRPGRRARAAVHQVRHGFGLGQVQLVVQEGPQREFARFGRPRPEAEGLAQQPVAHHHAAVTVQLDHVLPGGRSRARKEQHHATVDGQPRRIPERAHVGMAGAGAQAGQFHADVQRLRARHPHDGDRAPARWGGQCRDGIVVNHGSRPPPARRVAVTLSGRHETLQSAAMTLLIRHCCRMESPVLVSQ